MTDALLRIDVSRIRTNLMTLRAHIAPARVMFVVKDDAYGHGVDAVAAAGVQAGISWFGSFDVPTGLRVRAVAPTARVFTWDVATDEQITAALAADLDVGVGDRHVLERVAAVARGRGIRIHLKIDTGLHRNGVRAEEWPDFVARAKTLQDAGDVTVVGIWSHIAEASENDDEEARTVYERAVDIARAAGLSPDVLHLAASAAGYDRSTFRHDLVRFGAFGYGVRSTDGPDIPGIAPAATLFTRVSAVRGDEVTIAYGSLDGLPTTLGGHITVGTPGGPQPLVRVDPATSVVAQWPDAAVGDTVAIFGPGILGESSATTLAEAIGTVGEEILVRVSPLVPREYIDPEARGARR
ncbi:alanine racemase [Microbacterium koreense]|uniref:Alanine racemase n=1 Tax=Microbacterium koreense TaxID=323761 RepID=A0ABW2ZM79_9MICO